MIINHKQNPAGLFWHLSRCYWGLTCVCGWIRFTGSSIHWVPVSQQGSISGIGQCTERRNLVLMKTNRNGHPSPPPFPCREHVKCWMIVNTCHFDTYSHILYILNLIWAMIWTLPWNFTMHQSICSLDSMVDFNWTWQWQSKWKKRIAINVTAIVMYACSVEIWCLYVDRLALISRWRLYVIPII